MNFLEKYVRLNVLTYTVNYKIRNAGVIIMVHERLEELAEQKKLSVTERKYMDFIWEFENGVESDIIYKHFDRKTGTTGSILYKIAQKGYLRTEQFGKHYIHYPTVSKSDYDKAQVLRQLRISGFTSLSSLIASFCNRKSLMEDEDEKIMKLLEEFERAAGNDE